MPSTPVLDTPARRVRAPAPTATACTAAVPPGLPVCLAQGDAGTDAARGWLDDATRNDLAPLPLYDPRSVTGCGLVYVDPPGSPALAARFVRAARAESEPRGASHEVVQRDTSRGPTVWHEGHAAHPDAAVLRGPLAPEDYATTRALYAATIHGIATTVAHATRNLHVFDRRPIPSGYVVVEAGGQHRGEVRDAFLAAGVVLPYTYAARYGDAHDGDGTPMVVMVGWHREALLGLTPATRDRIAWVCGQHRGEALTQGILAAMLTDSNVRYALARRPWVFDPCTGLGMTLRALNAVLRGTRVRELDTHPGLPLPPVGFVGVEAVPSRFLKALHTARGHALRAPRPAESVAAVLDPAGPWARMP